MMMTTMMQQRAFEIHCKFVWIYWNCHPKKYDQNKIINMSTAEMKNPRNICFMLRDPNEFDTIKKAYDSTVSSPMLCVCALAHRNMNVLHSPSYEFKYIILLCKDSCWNIPQCPQRIAWDPFFSIPQIECAGVWNTRTLNHTQEKHFYSMSPHSDEKNKTKYIGNRIIESIKRVHKYYFGKINSSIPSNF